MRDLRLREGGNPIVCDLDSAAVVWLERENAATAVPAGPGRWELRARQKVGVVRIGETTVWIRPKLTIARLLWLLGWARKSVFTIPAPVGLEETAELVPALAEAFCLHAERALETGLLQGYSQVEATEPVLRGRLRGDEQLGRLYGLALPLAVRYDDYLVDIPENQLLKGAVGRLLRVPGLATGVQGRLRVLRLTLADVSAPAPGRLLPAWQPSRLNSGYHNALWLAEVILSGGSVEQEPGGIPVDGFLLDLDAVFEHFLTDTLTAGLERFGGRCQAQDPHTLDEDGVIDIRPDLVWRLGEQPAAVVDAKYKAEKPQGFPHADLYQAFAYATAYGLQRAHLVYAEGDAPGRQWTVRGAGIQLVAHSLDLSAAPDEVLQQVSTLAGRIADQAGLKRLRVVGRSG